jgi:fructose-bisphosphate aldolase class II
MSGLNGIVPPGVVTGDNLLKLMTYCRENSIALPAFNCTSSSTINATLEAAKVLKSPVIIQVIFCQNSHFIAVINWGFKYFLVLVLNFISLQFSNGGAAFMAGKGIKNDKQKAAILGSIAGAQHVRLMAKHYGIPVILHSDHCAKKLLEWFDGMIEADEAYFKVSFILMLH